jgi:hypothetical protein
VIDTERAKFMVEVRKVPQLAQVREAMTKSASVEVFNEKLVVENESSEERSPKLHNKTSYQWTQMNQT